MTIAPGTTAFYDRWAVDGEEAARSAMSRHFESAFAPGARVLDVGCGKGRDVVALLDMGFDAYGVEPNEAMRSRAIQRDPRVPGRVADAALPALGQPFGGGFDAVACSAVLMHLPAPALPASLAALTAVLKSRGRAADRRRRPRRPCLREPFAGARAIADGGTWIRALQARRHRHAVDRYALARAAVRTLAATRRVRGLALPRIAFRASVSG